MRSRLLSAATLVAAVIVLAASFVLFPHAGVPEYTQTVTQIPPDEVPDEAHVTQYESLSAQGQQVIDDGPGTVTARGERPDAFVYTDAPEIGRGIHYVEREGAHYRVETVPGGLDTDGISQTLVQATAALLGLVGGGFYYHRRAVASVILGLGSVSLVGVGASAPWILVRPGSQPWLHVCFGVWTLVLVAVVYVAWDQSQPAP